MPPATSLHAGAHDCAIQNLDGQRYAVSRCYPNDVATAAARFSSKACFMTHGTREQIEFAKAARDHYQEQCDQLRARIVLGEVSLSNRYMAAACCAAHAADEYAALLQSGTGSSAAAAAADHAKIATAHHSASRNA